MIVAKVAVCLMVLHSVAYAIEFPNHVVESPRVECMMDTVKLSVETRAGNPSSIFVKGRATEAGCMVKNTNSFAVHIDACGVTRERSLNPAGVFYKVCMVVQLHPLFITKVDRTFCASCFYMETVKEVTQELGISQMVSTELAVSFPMPTCTYSIRLNSDTGVEIKFATVGDKVYHVWHCPSDAYGVIVQNCYVDDGQGNRILIIDQNGCGIDQYVIQTPIYNNELNRAYQESHVFKFADKTVTRFTCQIQICVRTGGGCRGISPPNCSSGDVTEVNGYAASTIGLTIGDSERPANKPTYSEGSPPGISPSDLDRFDSTQARPIRADHVNRDAEKATEAILRVWSMNDSRADALTLSKNIVDVSGELYVMEDDKRSKENGPDRADPSSKLLSNIQSTICMSTLTFGVAIFSLTFAVIVSLTVCALHYRRFRKQISKQLIAAASHKLTS